MPMHADDDAPPIAKADARRRALAARDALPSEERDRLGAAVRARAVELPEIRGAGTIMSFASFRSEIDTRPLADWILAQGKALCLPRVLGSRRMAAYRITDWSADLAPGAWDIPEPRDGLEEVSPADLDAVLVPGSAFDAAGQRCGYGGGFYDSYLPLTRRHTPWIALAYEVQLVPRMTGEEHDLPVTVIVTESRVIRPG